MYHRLSLAAALATSILATPALAADDLEIVEAPEIAQTSGFYIAGRIARAFRDDTRTTYRNVTPAPLGVETEYSFGPALSVALGTGLVMGLRAEAEFSYDRNNTDRMVASTGGIFTNADFVHGNAEFYTLHATLLKDFDFGFVSPYVGIGAGVTHARFNGSGLTLPAGAPGPLPGDTFIGIDDHDTGFSYALHAGLNFQVTDNATFEIGYRAMNVHNLSFNGSDATRLSFGMTTQHRISVGMRIAF